jgi:hypothetical protein
MKDIPVPRTKERIKITDKRTVAPGRLKYWTRIFEKISPKNPPASVSWWRFFNHKPMREEVVRRITDQPANFSEMYFHSQRIMKLKAKMIRTNGIKKDEYPNPWKRRAER